MKVNAEAFYGAKMWRQSGEGETVIREGGFEDGDAKPYTVSDIRYTANHGFVYATCLNMKDETKVCMKALANTSDMMTTTHFSGIIKDVEVLGEIELLSWMVDQEGLKIMTSKVEDDKPVVFKIIMD